MNAAARASNSVDVSFSDVWLALRDGRWIIVGCLFLSGVAAAIAGFLMQPVYRAEMLLAPATTDQGGGMMAALAGQLGGLAGLAGIDLGQAGSAREENLALLRSKRLTEEFIKDENLLPVLFADAWDQANQRWKAQKIEDIPTMDDALELFDNEIREVREDSKTGLITIAFEWRDREQAVRWVTAFVERVNKAAQQRAINEANQSLEYLKRELESAEVQELRQVIYRLVESRISARMLANVRADYAFRVLDPARVPAENRYVRPKRALLIVGASFFGIVCGCAVVLMRSLFRQAMNRKPLSGPDTH